MITREERNLLQRIRRTLQEDVEREEAHTAGTPALRARRDRLMRDARDLDLLRRRLDAGQLPLQGSATKEE